MYSAIAANKRNTYIIMVIFIAIIAGIGWIFSEAYGTVGIFWGVLAGSIVYAIIQYFVAAKMALGLNRARQIKKSDNPRLYRIVENLAITDGLPTPKVYIMEEAAPNAFATGRDPNHSHVVVTRGLLNMMTDRELEAVVAHEMGHIKNYDIRVMMIVFGLVSAIGLLADIFVHLTWFTGDSENNNPLFFALGIIAAVLAPFVSLLVQMAVSRQREYLADATSAMTTRDPEGLESALAKIGKAGLRMRHANASTAHLFFANPFKAQSLAGLFSTHPPIEKRIARLKEMGKEF